MASSSSDVVILGLGVVLAALYLFKDQIFSGQSKPSVPAIPSKSATANGGGNPRDFIAKMKESVSNAYHGMSQVECFILTCPYLIRKNVLLSFTDRKRVPQRNTPSDLLKRQNKNSA